jgi:flagellar hook protein FlgE
VEGEGAGLTSRAWAAEAGRVNLSSVSGMRAANTLLDVTADNTANMDTEGYRQRNVRTETDATGGVRTTVTQADQPGVDLAEQAVNQVTATVTYAANARVLQSQTEMERALLDVRA